jgi:hypothetical protein
VVADSGSGGASDGRRREAEGRRLEVDGSGGGTHPRRERTEGHGSQIGKEAVDGGG